MWITLHRQGPDTAAAAPCNVGLGCGRAIKMDDEHSGQHTTWPHISIKSSTGLNPAKACIPRPLSQFSEALVIAAMSGNFSCGYPWNRVWLQFYKGACDWFGTRCEIEGRLSCPIAFILNAFAWKARVFIKYLAGRYIIGASSDNTYHVAMSDRDPTKWFRNFNVLAPYQIVWQPLSRAASG